MTHMVRLLVGAAVIMLALVATLPLLARPDRGAPPAAVPQVGRVFSVAQFVQPGIGPLWTTKRRTLFLIHGILQRVPMQPVADFELSDVGYTSGRQGEGGLALAAGAHDPVVGALLGVPLLRPLLPHTPDNPVLGRPATYRVMWIGCPPQGCSRSPWQLVSGGE